MIQSVNAEMALQTVSIERGRCHVSSHLSGFFIDVVGLNPVFRISETLFGVLSAEIYDVDDDGDYKLLINC